MHGSVFIVVNVWFTDATEQLLQQSAANGEEASELHITGADKPASQVNGEQQDGSGPTKAECVKRGVECIEQADVDGAAELLVGMGFPEAAVTRALAATLRKLEGASQLRILPLVGCMLIDLLLCSSCV